MSESDSVSGRRVLQPSECADGSRLDLLVLLRRRADALLPQEQLHFALQFALQHSGRQGVLSAILGALGAQANDSRDWEAYDMAETGIMALVLKVPEKQEAARIWHAQRHGCDPTQDAIAIFDLSMAVEKAAKLYPLSDPMLESKDRFVVQQLRDFLVERLGEKVPSLGERWRAGSRGTVQAREVD